MKKGFLHKIWVSGLACLLCVLTLWQVPAEAAASSLNYGKGAATDLEMTASELFDALYGDTETPLLPEERVALDALSEIMLRYNASVPPQLVAYSYDGDRGVLTVRAKSYLYTAENGKEVAWVPVQASIRGDAPIAFEGKNADGEYICEFGGIWNSDTIEADVTYAWQVEIPTETADGLLTYPYTVGAEALDAILAYESAKNTFDTETEAFENYKEEKRLYDDAKQAFDEYQDADRQYRIDKQAFDDYMIAKALFESQMQAFEEYKKKKEAYDAAEKAFYEYEQIRQQYAALYEKYEPYLRGVEAMQARLSIMESMFAVVTSTGWQFYGGVMGGTVDSVIANRYKLETEALVDRKYIDNAKKATEQLRPLLKGYNDLRTKKYKTDLEKQKSLFAYYTENYEEIRDSVILLYDSVYRIYNYSGVVAGMSADATAKEKQPRFRVFLAQLYILYCAFDTTVAPDATWVISKYDKKTYVELLDEKLLLPADINPSPEGVSVPEVEVELPESLPDPVEKPIKDFEDMEDPSVQGAPTPVDDPGDPPAVVKDPGDPPAVVDPPSIAEPTAPVIPSEIRALAELLRSNSLPQRQARNASQSLTLTSVVEKTFRVDNRKTVSFYDHNGNLIERVAVEYGSSVTAPNVVRAPDEVYSSHIFLGWFHFGDTDINNRVSLQCVTTDLDLIPRYDSTKRVYEITWIIDGKARTTTHYWGETPVCPYSTEKTDPQYEYVFTGWSPTVTAVQGNATYEAEYAVQVRRFTVRWDVAGRVEETVLTYGEMPVCPISTDRPTTDRIYTFIGWDQVLRAVTADVTYTAQYQETLLATYNDGSACPVVQERDFLVIQSDRPVVCFTNASVYARENGKGLILKWGIFEVKLSVAELAALEKAKCTKLELVQDEGAYEGCVSFTVRHLNDRGIPLTVKRKIPLTVRYTPEAGKSVEVYRTSGKNMTPIALTRYADGRAECSVDAGVVMEYRPEYRMSFSDANGKCDLSSFPQYAPIGSEIKLDANCEYGYEIASAVIRYADGRERTVTEGAFLMEKDIVSVALNVVPIVYRVQFVVEGTVISEENLFFGEKVTVPADPYKPEDDQYIYRFEGWTPYVEGATVGEDHAPVFTATFSRIAKEPTVSSEPVKDRFLTVVVPIAGCLFLLFIVAIVLVILNRRRVWRFLKRAWRWIRAIVSRVRDGRAKKSAEKTTEKPEETNGTDQSE